MNLMTASNQWATRPADERFWDLDELETATLAHRNAARNGSTLPSTLRVEAQGDELTLFGKTGTPATMTNWAFSQLCAKYHMPAGYLRDITPTLAAQNVNFSIKKYADDKNGETKLLMHQNGGYYVRAILSERYTRIWNSEIVRRLKELVAQDASWRVPPSRPAVNDPRARPATEADVLTVRNSGLSIQVGDQIAPGGLFASFEDMFVLMVNEHNRIDDGSEFGLSRGFMIQNSEVGKSAFKIITFLYRMVCGNLILWNAEEIEEISLRHVGDAGPRMVERLQVELAKYVNLSAGPTEQKIRIAQTKRIAAKPEDVIDYIFRYKLLGRKVAEEAMAAVVVEQDGDPLSYYGFAQGITRLSQQDARYIDQRVQMDRSAGKLIEMAF